jgi:uncharacterized protein with PIN domain
MVRGAPIPRKEVLCKVCQTELCDYIRNLSDEDLDEVVLFPVLAQDLLEHAAHCQECGDRIEAMDRKQFAQLPREEQAAYEEMARAFVSRTFSANT